MFSVIFCQLQTTVSIVECHIFRCVYSTYFPLLLVAKGFLSVFQIAKKHYYFYTNYPPPPVHNPNYRGSRCLTLTPGGELKAYSNSSYSSGLHEKKGYRMIVYSYVGSMRHIPKKFLSAALSTAPQQWWLVALPTPTWRHTSKDLDCPWTLTRRSLPIHLLHRFST